MYNLESAIYTVTISYCREKVPVRKRMTNVYPKENTKGEEEEVARKFQHAVLIYLYGIKLVF